MKNVVIKYATVAYIVCSFIAFIMTCVYMNTVANSAPTNQTYAAFMG